MTSLRIGNSFNGDEPANAVISGFRAGARLLSGYEYHTLPYLTILNGEDADPDGSVPIEIDEVKRFFDRGDAHTPEMTTGALMFAPLTDDYEHDYYTRIDEEHMVDHVDKSKIRDFGFGDIEDETVGMQFRVYQNMEFDAGEERKAYFDNARFEVSNILWEFSPDSGEESWYQLFDLPNRAYTRMTLPEATTTLRARAVSNSPDEWVQAFAITPIPDMQGKSLESS